MRLQEVIQSGKPFKLPYHDDFIITKLVNGRKYFFQEVTNMAIGFFAADLILSNDWFTKDLPTNVIKFEKRPKKI